VQWFLVGSSRAEKSVAHGRRRLRGRTPSDSDFSDGFEQLGKFISATQLLCYHWSSCIICGVFYFCCCRYTLDVAGLRHVQGIRPNGAAKYRGPQFWTLKFPYKLSCQFERLWHLDYGTDTDINAETRCRLRAYNATKCDCSRVSILDTAREAYTTVLPRPLSWF